MSNDCPDCRDWYRICDCNKPLSTLIADVRREAAARRTWHLFEAGGTGIYLRTDEGDIRVAISSARDSAFIAGAPLRLLRLVEEVERLQRDIKEATAVSVARESRGTMETIERLEAERGQLKARAAELEHGGCPDCGDRYRHCDCDNPEATP